MSGGLDSMAMLNLFQQAGIAVGVAHCNFQLRGADADADEALVRKVCSKNNIPCFSTRFNTATFAQQNNLSIQLAARKLRYDFFELVRKENSYDVIATAHHLNDSIETALLNFIRGTGVKGLSGIPVKNEYIIRPMLFAMRDQITEYAKSNNLEWREDMSNAEDDYQRNFIRHKITPLLKELNPNLEHTTVKTLERISGAVEMTQSYLAAFRSKSVQQKSNSQWINVADVREHNHAQVLLWELLKPYGFNYDQCSDIVATVQPGKQFFSSTHRLSIDRDFFILTERDQTEIAEVLIGSDQDRVSNGYEDLQISHNKDGRITIEQNPAVAILDASNVSFPLRWRPWQPGDFFQPLGMQSNKKLSDFLIDAKIPSAEKEYVTVVESAGKIVWVVGMRISDDVKITPETTASIVLKVAKTHREKIL